MGKKRNIFRGTAVLLAVALLFGSIKPFTVSAAKKKADIVIRTGKELEQLAENCMLDTWSQGKRVLLKADIDLKGEFIQIPSFGGGFDGNGHTISGLDLSEEASCQGLFRYIQKSGTVKNLHVQGNASAPDGQSVLGGIAGSNEGTIADCSFSGRIDGNMQTGGIAGVNEADGSIYRCRVKGMVTGREDTGGIAGRNSGMMTGCVNQSRVNTVYESEQSGSVDLTASLDQENIESTTTNTGGITGSCTGILQNCTNKGTVGYPHVGYNVGGIAGTSSGYVENCRNTGKIMGRKDTGGIAGQMIPEINMVFTQDMAQGLTEELDILNGMLSDALDGPGADADSMTQQFMQLLDSAQDASGSIRDLSDAVTDGTAAAADGAAETMSAAMERLTDILADGEGILNEAALGMDTLEQALNQSAQAGSMAGQVSGEAGQSMDILRGAMTDMTAGLGIFSSAWEKLWDALPDQNSQEVKAALEQINQAADRLTAALRVCTQTLKQLTPILSSLDMPADTRSQLQKYMNQLMQSMQSAGRAVQELAQNLNILAGQTDWTQLQDAAQKVSAVMNVFFQDTVKELEEGIHKISSSLEEFQNSFQFQDAQEAEKILAQLHEGMEQFQGAVAKCSDAAKKIAQILARGKPQEEQWKEVMQIVSGGQLTPEQIKQAADILMKNLDQKELQKQMAVFRDSMDEAISYAGEAVFLLNALAGEVDWKGIQEAAGKVNTAVKDFGGLLKDAGEELNAIRRALKDLAAALQLKDPAAIRSALERIQSSAAQFRQALQSAGAALRQIQQTLSAWSLDPALQDALRRYLSGLADGMDDAAGAVQEMFSGFNRLNAQMDWALAQDAMRQVRAAMNEFIKGGEKMSQFFAGMRDVFGGLQGMSGPLEEGMSGVADSLDIFESCTEMAGDTADSIYRLSEFLSEREPVSLNAYSQDFRQAEDMLYGTLARMNSQMKQAVETAQGSTGRWKAELNDIARQFQIITELFVNADKDADKRDADDIWRDVSEEAAARSAQGKLKDCVNSGPVEGDLNIGGIAGVMSVEYELDPEEDIQMTGEETLRFYYETRAVIQGCRNEGDIVSKKDAAGGVAGRMSLGYVLECENYGAVESTEGDYAGGIAGISEASVRRSYAKCRLAGNNYTGGIAGYGYGIYECTALVFISRADGCAGAIAGDWDRRDGELSQNRFVPAGTAGADGVSYGGKAEPVSYRKLIKNEELPAEFDSMKVEFAVDGKTVKAVSCGYGKPLAEEKIPDVPQKEGYYGVWEETGADSITHDYRLEAVYTPYAASLPGGGTRDGVHDVFLVEGRFSGDTELKAQLKEESSGKERWDVRLEGDADKNKNKNKNKDKCRDTDTYTMRFTPFKDWEEVSLRLISADGEREIPVQTEGSCYVFTAEGKELAEGCVIEASQKGRAVSVGVWLWITALAAIVCLLTAANKRMRQPRRQAD